jgi:hypothetical protein
MDTEFSAELWEWRGPAPFYWLTLPEDSCAYIRAESTEASYGWGAIPVCARIGATEWETSLLPKSGGYVLPVKSAPGTAPAISDVGLPDPKLRMDVVRSDVPQPLLV